MNGASYKLRTGKNTADMTEKDSMKNDRVKRGKEKQLRSVRPIPTLVYLCVQKLRLKDCVEKSCQESKRGSKCGKVT